MNFTKMHGIGNDYIYINCFEQFVSEPSSLAVQISDRHFGVGGDGLVLILPSDIGDFKMRMFNADGSEGKMCGNAIRCVGKYVFENGMTAKTDLNIETLSGTKQLRLFVENDTVTQVSVDMGMVILEADKIPILLQKDKVINESIEVDGKLYDITCVSMGNPHVVVFMNGIDEFNIEKTGPKFENHPIFPDRVNTEFVELIDKTVIKMRVWERGSGETLACGTGACASVVAAVLNGYCEQDCDVTVKLRGGDLKIRYNSDGNVTMTGGATTVFTGTYSCVSFVAD